MTPQKLLQVVASGLLGNAAFDGGWGTALLGLALHFGIAVILVALFYSANWVFNFLIRYSVASGLAYGFCIYWVMRLVVVPMSAFPGKMKFVPVIFATELPVHMFLVGLPIALAVRKAIETRSTETT